MTCKWGHPVATLPSDEGDYTSLVVGPESANHVLPQSLLRFLEHAEWVCNRHLFELFWREEHHTLLTWLCGNSCNFCVIPRWCAASLEAISN
eukprot:6214687-Pleurochrysis_carterae.AAC.6